MRDVANGAGEIDAIHHNEDRERGQTGGRWGTAGVVWLTVGVRPFPFTRDAMRR